MNETSLGINIEGTLERVTSTSIMLTVLSRWPCIYFHNKRYPAIVIFQEARRHFHGLLAHKAKSSLKTLTTHRYHTAVQHYTLQWVFILVFTAVLTLLTWRGLVASGTATIVLAIIVLMPYFIFVCLGAGKVQPANWLDGPENHQMESNSIKWRSLLNILFWCNNSYDHASAFGRWRSVQHVLTTQFNRRRDTNATTIIELIRYSLSTRPPFPCNQRAIATHQVRVRVC